MGVAPLSPTHETNSLPLFVMLRKGSRQRNTLSGRATRIMNTPMSKPTAVMSSISCGLTSSPRVMKMTIWNSQVSPLIKVLISFRKASRVFPRMTPMM